MKCLPYTLALPQYIVSISVLIPSQGFLYFLMLLCLYIYIYIYIYSYKGHIHKMEKTKTKIHTTVSSCLATITPDIKLKEE